MTDRNIRCPRCGSNRVVGPDEDENAMTCLDCEYSFDIDEAEPEDRRLRALGRDEAPTFPGME